MQRWPERPSTKTKTANTSCARRTIAQSSNYDDEANISHHRGLGMIPESNVDKTTYTIGDFLQWQRHGALVLNPNFQRRSVWNIRAKGLLIDSILRGYPIPLIFLTNRINLEDSSTIRDVVDGQQRLRTVLSYLDPSCLPDYNDADKFTVSKKDNPEYGEKTFAELDQETRQRILQTPLSVNVLPASMSNVEVLEIFRRMNTTGMKLNKQELRNAKFFGAFKDLSYDLAYAQYQRWIKWGVFTLQQTSQMLEVEQTSDLLGLLLEGVRGRSYSDIDRLYDEYDDQVPHEDELRHHFSGVMDYLEEVYGDDSDRPVPKRFRSTTWLYAAFAVVSGADIYELTGRPRDVGPFAQGDAIDLGSARPSPSQIRDAFHRAEKQLKEKGRDDELSALRSATSHKANRELRIRFLRDLIAND